MITHNKKLFRPRFITDYNFTLYLTLIILIESKRFLLVRNDIEFQCKPDFSGYNYRVFIMHCKESEIPKFRAPSVVLQCRNETDGCNEAIPYIKAIYDWYDKITEENMVFMHSHVRSWHIGDLTKELEPFSHTSYFREMEYGGFESGCWKNGCDDPTHYEPYNFIYNNVSGMPTFWDRWGVYPCCATFFVKTEVVRRRPRSEYKKILDNAIAWAKTKGDKGKRCGYMFEFTWHLLFTGKQLIEPPPSYRLSIKRNFTKIVCPYGFSNN